MVVQFSTLNVSGFLWVPISSLCGAYTLVPGCSTDTRNSVGDRNIVDTKSNRLEFSFFGGAIFESFIKICSLCSFGSRLFVGETHGHEALKSKKGNKTRANAAGRVNLPATKAG